ncbi:CYTH and CHAD domain-containing protein [Streptomyces hebeiensis]
MADMKREVERKYELPEPSGKGAGKSAGKGAGKSVGKGAGKGVGKGGPVASGGTNGLPDLTRVLTRVGGVASVAVRGVVELDAVYYDTADLRLAADSVTLRRRRGGADEGWHLKLPVSADVRDEIRAPLAGGVPAGLAALVRSRTRDAELIPVVRLRSSRDVSHLLDAEGNRLAEVSVDSVRAQRLGDRVAAVAWTEIEVELADGTDPALLDAVDKRLRKAGLRRSAAPSKLARALAETAPGPGDGPGPPADTAKTAGSAKTTGSAKTAGAGEAAGAAVTPAAPAAFRPRPVTAGDHVLAYLRAQADAIVAQDPAVRRDLPDAVHQLRVATRRMRSTFRTHRALLDRAATDPVADELKWLAAELGVDRDHEVLDARLRARAGALPAPLLLGPVSARLQTWHAAGSAGSRERTLAVLDSPRYLALLTSIDTLLADPPLRPAAARKPGKALPKAILKAYGKLADRTEHALALPPGPERDAALHGARKAAKRARYAAEAARPALGKPAKRFAKRVKAVQTLLGEHQDSVVARDALRALAIKAHAAGESAFTWGLLYGQEQARAADSERELPGVWARASARKIRSGLTG